MPKLIRITGLFRTNTDLGLTIMVAVEEEPDLAEYFLLLKIGHDDLNKLTVVDSSRSRW